MSMYYLREKLLKALQIDETQKSDDVLRHLTT
jgi:hypothetical protein